MCRICDYSPCICGSKKYLSDKEYKEEQKEQENKITHHLWNKLLIALILLFCIGCSSPLPVDGIIIYKKMIKIEEELPQEKRYGPNFPIITIISTTNGKKSSWIIPLYEYGEYKIGSYIMIPKDSILINGHYIPLINKKDKPNLQQL